MRRKLVESALLVFAEKGVDVPVIDDVIAAAGVSRGTFYNYFRTNAELLVAAIEELGNELVDMIESRVEASPSPAERLFTGFRLYLEAARRFPLFARFIARVGPQAIGPDNLVYKYIPIHIAQGIKAGEFIDAPVGVAADIIVGAGLAAVTRISARRADDTYLHPRNGGWNTTSVHKMLNYKAFMPSFTIAEQLVPSQQFQRVTRQLPFLGSCNAPRPLAATRAQRGPRKSPAFPAACASRVRGGVAAHAQPSAHPEAEKTKARSGRLSPPLGRNKNYPSVVARLPAGSDLLIILTFTGARTGVGVRFAPRTLQPVARLKAKSAPQALSSVGPQLLGFIGKCSCQGRGSLRPSSGMNVSISV